MNKHIGSQKGQSEFYAKARKKSAHGSGAFTAAEEKQGYSVFCASNELNTMDIDRRENIPDEFILAKRRESNTGGHAKRLTFRRSQSKKGSY